MMNRTIYILSLAVLAGGCSGGVTPLYKQADAPVEKRVDDLLSRMTLEEKILQLSQYTFGPNDNVNNIGEKFDNLPDGVGSFIFSSDDLHSRNELQRRAVENTRLGIPIIFGCDVIHGFGTIYPIPLAQACSWNPDLVEELSAMAASEARPSGVDWTFSPMIDIARDARWGRVAEGYGEDPYMASVMGCAAVRGYQGESLSDSLRVAACLKHYAGYGRSEGGRDYTATDISLQSLWETYLPPYEACIKEGAKTVMSAFNDINGVPATAHRYLLTDVLKGDWGFDGFVVSDWNAVRQLVSQGYADSRKQAAEKAIKAGLDMDMRDDCFRQYLSELVDEGKVGQKEINEAVRRILRVKFELGLFENPYRTETDFGERCLKPESIELSAKMAEESMVLLKNNGVLPLSKGRKYSVIGPVADDAGAMLGSWKCHGRNEDTESILEGIRNVFGAGVSYTRGCDFDGSDKSGFAEAVAMARRSDAVILCLGEKAAWSGENASRSSLRLPRIQEDLAEALSATGKPIILLLVNGRPLELASLEKSVDAILEVWQPGTAGGTPAARILLGDINPSGRLCITFPLTSGQIPIYYNHRQSSRPDMGLYQDIPSVPLYDFGYGLSYTEYDYGDMVIEKLHGGKYLATIDVTNSGKMDGFETVQWFIRDPFCSITRPVKELRYFEKRFIKAGETQRFTFEIDPMRDLAYVDGNGKRLLEDGEYRVIVKDKTVSFDFTVE